jgi:dipeptidyl aminopeptidase/acylaminoacyl peptidase
MQLARVLDAVSASGLHLTICSILFWSNVAASLPAAPNQSKVAATADDLVRLSDLGPSSPGPGEHIVGLSPDGKLAAVQVRTADPSTNRYQIRIDVIDLSSHDAPRTIDEGGELALQYVSGIGGRTVSTGYPAVTPLVWSPDGTWVYFLKHIGKTAQVWRAAARGGVSAAVTREAGGVDDFAVSKNCDQLTYLSHRPNRDLQAALRGEYLRGFQYDARFIPLFDDRPQQSDTTPITRVMDLRTDITRDATASEAASFGMQAQTTREGPAAISKTGETALITEPNQGLSSHTGKVTVRRPNGPEHICGALECWGATTVWWTKDGNRVRFMRRQGWGNDETAIYEWQPGAAHAKRMYVTQDLLIDCQPVDDRLVCARERSADPRHIIVLDLDSGIARTIYDPNEGFHQLSLGNIERLHWRNEFGTENFGDLVYPVGYVRGHPYPLIIVQYISRGFLRGGVGDEFPIQAFANRGYAVLSVQRPDTEHLRSVSVTDKGPDGWSNAKLMDRRNVLSSIETAVQTLIDRGIANPHQIGITGLSDGSSTVQFALINSSMFKAASVSGCCWDPYQDAIVGPGAAEAYHQSDCPELIRYNSPFWSHISLIGNASRVGVPLLIQQSDDEFRGAINSYTALKQAGRTVAMFVFPDEHHVKWQPAHRLAAYNRNLRWFDFWLRGIGSAREWQ